MTDSTVQSNPTPFSRDQSPDSQNIHNSPNSVQDHSIYSTENKMASCV